MLDYEKLIVYQKALFLNSKIWNDLVSKKELDRNYKDQLIRASSSIVLNIAEGCSRISIPSKRNFFVIARGSALECGAIFDILKNISYIEDTVFLFYYVLIEEISKMLFALIKKLQ